MLKRIKIRGKLLLLLTVPLLAVLLFAASGVVDRTELTDGKAREARLAQVADAGADLAVALQVERFETIQAGRLTVTTAEYRSDQLASNAALDRWSQTVENVLVDISDPALADSFVSVRDELTRDLDEERIGRPAGAVADRLQAQTDQLTAINIALAREATDLELFRSLDTFVQLIEIQDSVNNIAVIGTLAIDDGRLGVTSPALIDAEVRLIEANMNALEASADDKYVELLVGLQTDGFLPGFATDGGLSRTDGFVPAIDILEAVYDGIVVGGVAWIAASEERLVAINGVIDVVLRDANFTASFASEQAAGEARSFLILAGSVVVFALLMALLIGRSVSRPLIDLTHGAEQLSAEELPAMVESMRTAGRTPAPMMTPIQAKGRDEVAQLARAFSEIQSVTVEVAEEQGELLQRGISDIFINLARRNQSLLDRQIDFIDQLESREESPDQLENLFRLDHLATRMRRNAESLLVLAGAEPSRRRGKPVELADVVRVAMGEIEDFSRIQLLSVDSATVAGSVAVDLAHLMSELMENATQFSPPEFDVEVVGHRSADGSYQLTLTDKGIGMSAEQISGANDTLAEPPVIGLDLSRSLGFTVVSRLADRLGVTVRLTSASDGGVTALVTVPAEMVGTADDTDRAVPIAEPSAPVAEPAPLAAPTPIALVPDAPVKPEPKVEIASSDELAALPMRRPTPVEPEPVTADLFDVFKPIDPTPAPPTSPGADIFAPLDKTAAPLPSRTKPVPESVPAAPGPWDQPSSPAPPDMAEPIPTAVTSPPVAPRPAAEVGAVDHSVTSAGLIRRTPRHVDVPDGSKFATAQPVAQAPTPANRSPEEVREMLSRYRAGLRKGRGPKNDDGQQNSRS